MMSLAFLCVPALAQARAAVGAVKWSVYGASSSLGSDAAVSGGNIVQIHIEKRTANPWDRGAVLSLPYALHKGERISVSFWARAERPVKVPITLHAAAAPYASFAVTPIALTPDWQQFTIGGIAPSDLAANTQSLAVMVGTASADVFLGPAIWALGDTATAVGPASRDEDVRIISEPGVMIEGTLRTPAGKGPFPLVVCFSGSGPGTRGAFRLVGDHLLAEGIAIFDFDKRGTGKSTGIFDDRIPLIQADAAVVVRALRARPEIDDARIAVCGLSQGGVIGPLVAADDSKIAAVIIFAGPAGTNPEMFLNGMRAQLQKDGRNPANIDHISDVVREWMDARSTKQPATRIAALRTAAVEAFATDGRDRKTAEGAVAILDTPVLLSMYEVQPNAALARIKVPVLALYGEKDTVVDPAQAIPEVKAALRDNPDATVLEIPGAGHAFSDEMGFPFSIPQVLDGVTQWLVKRLHPLKDESGK